MIVDCPQCGLRHVILERAPGTVARCSCGTEMRLPHNELDAVKCANCGGNPPEGETHCPWCDAHLTTLRCGRCLASAVEGDQHCRACGHALAVPVRNLQADPPKPLPCPRCDQTLVSILVGDAVLDECRRCGGDWLEHEVFDEIVRSREDRDALLDAIARMRPANAQTATATQWRRDEPFYVKCPECAKIMQRRQFARISGVVVDVCADHGIWFDRSELTGVIEFVGDGGLERARQHLHVKRLRQAKRREANRKPVDLSELYEEGGPLAAKFLVALVALLLSR